MSELSKDFGTRLKSIIKSEGLTQKAFAEIFGMPLSTIATYCQGRVPDGETLVKIAEYFGLTVDYLLTGRSPWEANVVVGGKAVREETAKYGAIQDIMELSEEEAAKVRIMLDLIRSDARKRGGGAEGSNTGGNKAAAS